MGTFMFEKLVSEEAITGRIASNYHLVDLKSSPENNRVIRGLDVPSIRLEIERNFEAIKLLLDEQYSLLALEAKIAHVDFMEGKVERHSKGGKYGYLCSYVDCCKGVLSCRFYKREPMTNSGKMFTRTHLNPGKMRKVSYRALQKASGDIEELRDGMQTEVTFRWIRDSCVEVSKMRAKVRHLMTAVKTPKSIREVFKIDPRDIKRAVTPYNHGPKPEATKR